MTRITVEALFQIARNLKSENGENPEYDRALVEVCTDAAGFAMDEKARVAGMLGIVKFQP